MRGRLEDPPPAEGFSPIRKKRRRAEGYSAYAHTFRSIIEINMETIGKMPKELKGIVSYIQRRMGNCERLFRHSVWHGHKIFCTELFCSYGCIGYKITYRGYCLHVDNEQGKITMQKDIQPTPSLL